MISVIFIWLYMLFTCYLTGFLCVKVISGNGKFKFKRETDYFYAGIGAVTVYAQIFSIFGKVGLLANVILLIACILICVWLRRELAERFRALRLTVTPGRTAMALLLFLAFAYGTSRGYIHYDTGLYHAQSIRWIEEYGVVPGLGNLHSRLAYNSSAFCLSALYSMAFLGGRSYHCCAGFLAFLLSLVCSEMIRKGFFQNPRLSDFARIIGIYYLLNIFDEMISPASDYFMVLLVLFIVIRWLELLERKEKSFFPYAMLSVMCVVVISVKLSGALTLLLALLPAVQMVREKRVIEIFKFIGTGILVIAPFLIRNVILSGWLIYPFTAVDLFDVDFKIPKGMAEYDAREIQVWGRGYSDVTLYGQPIVKWMPEWIRGLGGVDTVFLALAVSGTLLFLWFAGYALWKKKKEMLAYLHAAGTLTICFLFWLFSAPLIRYGCVFLWLVPVVTWGYLYLKISPHMDRFRVYGVFILLAGVYKAGAFGTEQCRLASADYLILQKDYDRYETESYELHGYTFYYSPSGDRTGYDAFPASPVKAEDIFRGETIEEGFKDVIHS
ncbi:MAG: hypothetical protein NC429_13185 [Lachnospiraceae bacterium]|nr:hypothetical protein [Lachnospiraceae bacterium]